MSVTRADLAAGIAACVLVAGVATGAACLFNASGQPQQPTDFLDGGDGIFAGPSFPIFGALPPPDADLRDRFHFCRPWSGGSAPTGTRYFGASVYIDPGSSADNATGLVPSDAGVQLKYGLLIVGIPPNDGGVVSAVKQRLTAAGIHPVDDHGIKALAGAPPQKAWMASGGCEVYLWLTEATDVPVSAVVTCAAGPGCWVSRKKVWGLDGGFTTGFADTTFQPGSWKYPDGGAGHVCVPKVCVELAGRGSSMPKECR